MNLDNKVKKLLFKIAKEPFMGKIVGKAFQHCSWAIPVKKVYSSKEIIAFYHPSPHTKIILLFHLKKQLRICSR